MPLKVELARRDDGETYEGEAKSVTLPAAKGEMQILPGHIAMITATKAGRVVIEKEDGNKTIEVGPGVAAVGEDCVHILIGTT